MVVTKCFELDGVARWIAQEHRRLLAHLAGKADPRCDQEIYTQLSQPRGEFMPSVPRQDCTEMPGRNIVAVDRVQVRLGESIYEMRRYLMAVKVEIDPTVGLASDDAIQHPDIEVSCLDQVGDRKRQMEPGPDAAHRQVPESQSRGRRNSL